MSELVLTGVRWSGLVGSRCGRRVWFEHTGAEKDLPDERTLQMWARGHRYEQIIAEEVLDELASRGIVGERQAVLDWPDRERPIGQTHLDILAPVGDAIRVVEVKSNAGAQLTESAALQVSGQALLVSDMVELDPRDGHAEPLHHDVDAIVVCVDSHTGERRDHRVQWEHYAHQVEELWMLARLAVDATEIPPRVAPLPSDARCMFCPFRASCWEGWEPGPLEQVLGLDEVGAELAGIKTELALAKEIVKGIEERQAKARAKLRPHLPLGELVDVGRVPIRLTVSPVTTFAYGEAVKAGLELPEEFEPYISHTPREYWTVKA